MAVNPLQEELLQAISNAEGRCMAYNQIIDMFYSEDISIFTITHNLNVLVDRGSLHRYKAVYNGRRQNHYKAAK